jgi:hypothetical protein
MGGISFPQESSNRGFYSGSVCWELWEALVKTHKYSIYGADRGCVHLVYTVFQQMWIFMNASQSCQQTKFYIEGPVV